MKINIKILQENEACIEGFNWFINHYGVTSIDVCDIITQLEEEKDSNGWISWLFEEFQLTGICKGWYTNGELMYEFNYENGEYHGICKRWYRTGELEYEYNFKDGKRHGICKYWYDNGELAYEFNYKDGRLI